MMPPKSVGRSGSEILRAAEPTKKGGRNAKAKPIAPKSASPSKKRPAQTGASQLGHAFPIVTIGASAGGLEAYKEFFNALAGDTGMAFVLIQHLDPRHHSMLAEILSKAARIPVDEVKEGVKVKPNCVYVIPPGTLLAITAGTFTLTPRSQEAGQHLPVDFFMRSLAEERKSGAIGVILSGTGTDGTLGLESIKGEGGITFAQDPVTAKYDGMPRSAIDSGCVDFVLAPKEIAQELHRIRRHPYIRQDQRGAEERGKELTDSVAAPPHEADFIAILDQLRKSSGVDFRQYKPNTIHRRALRRAMILKLDSLGEYANYLKEHPEEGPKLYDDVLIPVTSFFRDFEAFEALKAQVYPAIVNDKGNKGTIRMWAPGCSTGEETYSLAMTLLEFLGDRAASFLVQIFGTDLNEKGIQKARAGMYRESIAEEISPERLQRFFVKVEGGYRVNKAVRDMCVFARQNLANDPPFSQMNLVACRNLLIYIQPALQKKIIPILHYALKPSGFLILGGSESVAAFPDLFTTVDKKHKIYSKKAITSRLHYDFVQSYYPTPVAADALGKPSKSEAAAAEESDLQAEADRLVLQNYGPAGVVVNHAMEVLHFRGRTAPYLEQAPGKASLNLLKLARNGLGIDLRILIRTAAKKSAPATKEGVAFDDDGQKRILNLSVSPLGKKDSADKGFFLVLFDDVTSQGSSARTPSRTKESSADKLESQQLKRQLHNAQDALRSVVESEDSLKEEFQSANEEILSANEELQSTNEELETSKEELQSANEELNTLNAELRNKNNDLHELSNDISNFLNSTRIPVVMLDRRLRIRRVTPTADRLLKAVPSDIGRPIADLRLNVDLPELESLITGVLESLQPVDREVRDLGGRWHSLNILPYRTQDDRIEGVVLALHDIDAVKTANERLRKSTEFFRGVMNTVVQPLLVLDSDLRVIMANEQFLSTFKVSPEETIERFLYSLGGGQWNIPQLRTLLEEVLPKRQTVRSFAVEQHFEGLGFRTILLNAQTLSPAPDAEQMILLAMEDITERKHTDLAKARLAAIVECSDDAIIGKNLDGIIETWNAGAERLFGYTPEEAIGHSVTLLIPADRVAEEPAILERIRRGEHINHYESVRRRKDGRLLDVSLTISPIVDAQGQIVGASKIARDITDRKLAEAALIKSEKLAAAGRLAATLAHEINNPLQAVTNLMSLLGGSPRLDANEQGYAAMAEEELRRVVHLTQQSLSFYRESIYPVAVNLDQVLDGVLDLYAKRLQVKEIVVTKRDRSNGTAITSYPGEIRQVLSTLLLNSMDAVPPGGKISVGIRRSHHWNNETNGVRLAIGDSGVGIPTNHMARIFEPFFTTKGEQGTGLGLWVANGIVSRLGGSIHVRSSVRPGKRGTTFSIFLPIRLPERT
jgi:two-component system CheB/CheR fusion protein